MKRAISDFYRFADFEADFWFHLFFALFHLREHAVHFRLAHRDRFVLGPGKTDHTGCVPNEVPGAPDKLIVFVEQIHVHDQIAREKFARCFALFALLNFRNALGRDEDFVDQVAHFLSLNALEDILAHLVFLSGKHVHDEPLIFACERLCHKSVQPGEKVDKVHKDEIEKGHVTTEQ